MFCQVVYGNVWVVLKNTEPRKVPSQARSKERVERILNVASGLVERDGSSDLKMAEVAELAGVPIGSVYQYFPNRSAIIRALAERFHGRVRQMLAEEMADVRSAVAGAAALDRVLDRYYGLCLEEPVFRDIWWGAQADKSLQEKDIEDSRTNGRIIYEALEPFVPEHELSRLGTTCLLLTHLAGSAVGMAVSINRREGDDMLKEFKRLLRCSIADLSKEPEITETL